ncbi:Hsp20/alpha crystallin family protein [uncultured Methylovirgula sp.]|uniref:Hsp20/alpha crystallin family protein n=1 Tax=uncultured Methylovirgula sp. TaxID=1285960 RepID=UPI00260D6590|nr:Hsp20/alpha crystallin family protein [uncultured Methylovirgula sp.]
MAEAATKLPVKTEKAAAPSRPFVSLRQEIDRLFEDFGRDFWVSPFRSLRDIESSMRRENWASAPAVDIVENDKAFEVTAELPGMDEKSIDVQVANGGLTIKGEKHEETEEKRKDYFLRERRFGSFERSFRLPEGVDKDKIEAVFKKGVLTVTLPKSAEAQKAAKKIEVKATA